MLNSFVVPMGRYSVQLGRSDCLKPGVNRVAVVDDIIRQVYE